MSSNSQFRQLSKRVEALEAQLGKTDVKSQAQKQKALETAAEQWQHAQQAAKVVVADLDATPEQLEAAMPFLESRGMKEFARMEAEKKRGEQQMWQTMSLPVINDTRLIENLKRAAQDGSFYQWRDAMRNDDAAAVFAQPLPAPVSKSTVSTNAMKAAEELARQQYEQQVQIMDEHRGPLGNNQRDEAYIMFPNPLDGIVR